MQARPAATHPGLLWCWAAAGRSCSLRSERGRRAQLVDAWPATAAQGTARALAAVRSARALTHYHAPHQARASDGGLDDGDVVRQLSLKHAASTAGGAHSMGPARRAGHKRCQPQRPQALAPAAASVWPHAPVKVLRRPQRHQAVGVCEPGEAPDFVAVLKLAARRHRGSQGLEPGRLTGRVRAEAPRVGLGPARRPPSWQQAASKPGGGEQAPALPMCAHLCRRRKAQGSGEQGWGRDAGALHLGWAHTRQGLSLDRPHSQQRWPTTRPGRLSPSWVYKPAARQPAG